MQLEGFTELALARLLEHGALVRTANIMLGTSMFSVIVRSGNYRLLPNVQNLHLEFVGLRAREDGHRLLQLLISPKLCALDIFCRVQEAGASDGR